MTAPACDVLYEPIPGDWPYSATHWRKGTHTCRLFLGHRGEHQCPECGSFWDKPKDDGGLATLPGETAAYCDNREGS